jgi:hypothetical protein
VVSVTNPYGRITGFLDRRRYFFFQVAAQLYGYVIKWRFLTDNTTFSITNKLYEVRSVSHQPRNITLLFRIITVSNSIYEGTWNHLRKYNAKGD